MDIRDWPLDQIMQLPDFCFGRRWPITVQKGGLGIGIVYDISQMALPEWCVIWEVVYVTTGTALQNTHFDLRLSDVVPVSTSTWLAAAPLLAEFGPRTGEGNLITVSSEGGPYRITMKSHVHSMGRRLCGRIEFTVATPAIASAVVVISSIPTEVPDWLVSR